MEIEQSLPCMNIGAPSEPLVSQVVAFLNDTLLNDVAYLNRNGLSIDEMSRAFPAAIERIRGSRAASNQTRRDFVRTTLEHLLEHGFIRSLDLPQYGKDTLYRVVLLDGTKVGVVQKGCPDGAHSSINWERPEWADELFIWWCCSSSAMQPGEHVWKGVARLRKKIQSEPMNQLDGIIFESEVCGTPARPCPKREHSREIGGQDVPPPCVLTFPHWSPTSESMSWAVARDLAFPKALLAAFHVGTPSDFTGHVGFLKKGNRIRTEVESRFGESKITGYRGAIDAE